MEKDYSFISNDNLKILVVLCRLLLKLNQERFDIITLKRRHSKEDKEFIDSYYETEADLRRAREELQSRGVPI